MASPGPEPNEYPSTSDTRVTKRRKVRKGTQSCWECKRRKTRCTFSAWTPSEPNCDGCKSRRTRCVSQEFPDETSVSTGPSKQFGARLEHLEKLVSHLARGVDDNSVPNNRPSTFPRREGDKLSRARPLKSSSHSNPYLEAPGLEVLPFSQSGHRPRSNLSTVASPPLDRIAINASHELPRVLVSAWPSQKDLDIILNVPVGTGMMFHGIICAPYSKVLYQNATPARDVLKLPRPESHPILIARKLLLLATFLQSFPARAIQQLSGLSTSHEEIMVQAFQAAALVTGRDELVTSVEDIECIMIESMYHNNAGNLRRAWLANRRGMMLAQMMGLHNNGSECHGRSRPLKFVDPDTKGRVSPEHMWLRLVLSDRYLSLTLGLPQESPESPFVTAKALEGCEPMERLERLDAVAGGYILQRNGVEMHDLSRTREIDQLLQKAAAVMPAKWWLAPDTHSDPGDDMAILRETIRLMNQFAHFNILLQLHLPYLLRPSSDHKYDYNKLTAVSASRELLTRFVSFRGSGLESTSYCRGIDFLAFIASTTLCLAHLDGHGSRTVDTDNAVLTSLAHQRLGDRALMERTLESMNSMARIGDSIACRIARLLGYLLSIELRATEGLRYSTKFSNDKGVDDGELGCSGKIITDGCGMHIAIPHMGTIDIKHDGETKSTLPDNGIQSEQQPQAPLTSDLPAANSPLAKEALSADTGRFGSAQQYSATGLDSSDANFNFEAGTGDGIPPPFLDLSAGVDDWTLEGVDMTLFETIFRGSAADYNG